MSKLKLSMLQKLAGLNNKAVNRDQLSAIGTTPPTLEKYNLIKPLSKGWWRVDLPEGFHPETFFKLHQNQIARKRSKTSGRPPEPEVRRYINPYIPKQEKEVDRRPWKKMYRQLKSN